MHRDGGIMEKIIWWGMRKEEVLEFLKFDEDRRKELIEKRLSDYWLKSWHNQTLNCGIQLGYVLLRNKNNPSFLHIRSIVEKFISTLKLIKKEMKKRKFDLKCLYAGPKDYFDSETELKKNLRISYIDKRYRLNNLYHWLNDDWQRGIVREKRKIFRYKKYGICLTWFSFNPHYRCPACRIYLPKYFVENGFEDMECPECRQPFRKPNEELWERYRNVATGRAKVKRPKILLRKLRDKILTEEIKKTFYDPDKEERVCYDCLQLFLINKNFYWQQGFLCRKCQEKREHKEKVQKRRLHAKRFGAKKLVKHDLET